MNQPAITTLGALKASGYPTKSIKQELRDNLMQKISNGEDAFPGILGYEDTVIPDTERAILSRHHLLFLGLRGQAKTRMARQMTSLLDEYIPIVAGSEINDDPLAPVSKYAVDMIAEMGDDTPVEWLHRSQRYGEKLATPDVTVADLIGDIDPIKAAHSKLSFADERVIHYGIIPRCNRSVFVINELPDLQARIQVALFNILQEGDIQIRGFKLRLPLDIMFVFTANPEDYTNRGSIVTPLKDRIDSQILTHYPKSLDTALQITKQEAAILPGQNNMVQVHELIHRIIEQIAFEARASEWVDNKSGVSARLTISALENAVSAAERRALKLGLQQTQVWISDLAGIIPSITGKIELVYEGEQEGAFKVATHLMEKAIRTQFAQYLPNPEVAKKKYPVRKGTEHIQRKDHNPYAAIIAWFDKGNTIDLMLDATDAERVKHLSKVQGLKELVQYHFTDVEENEMALLMEFVLHGLSAYSLISKQLLEGRISFKDLMGGMLNMQQENDTDAHFSDEDFV